MPTNPERTWYPGALRIPAHFSRVGFIRAPNSIKRALIHITDGHGAIEGPAENWQKPGTTCAHCAIGQDGRVVQVMPFEAFCWHAHRASRDSIAIEHCARSPGELTKQLRRPDPGLPLTQAQLDSSVRVLAFVARAFNFMPSEVTIIGHSAADDRTDHDDCPDGVVQPDGVTVGWPWKWYRAEIEKALRAVA